MYLLQACMLFFGLAIILEIGFLYFVVMFMGVNPAALMATVITLMIAIVSTTIGDIISEYIMKTFAFNRKDTTDQTTQQPQSPAMIDTSRSINQ